MCWQYFLKCFTFIGGQLLRGQTNFVGNLWKFNSVFSPELQLADHRQPVQYEIPLPPPVKEQKIDAKSLYVHKSLGRQGRALDDATEKFVDEGRKGWRSPRAALIHSALPAVQGCTADSPFPRHCPG